MQSFYLGIDASKGYADFIILNSEKNVVVETQNPRLILRELVHDAIPSQKIGFRSLRGALAGDGISRSIKLTANEWASVNFYAYLHPPRPWSISHFGHISKCMQTPNSLNGSAKTSPEDDGAL